VEEKGKIEEIQQIKETKETKETQKTKETVDKLQFLIYKILLSQQHFIKQHFLKQAYHLPVVFFTITLLPLFFLAFGSYSSPSSSAKFLT
jgi:hypothetical protein